MTPFVCDVADTKGGVPTHRWIDWKEKYPGGKEYRWQYSMPNTPKGAGSMISPPSPMPLEDGQTIRPPRDFWRK